MLDRKRVLASLESKRELFTGYDAEFVAEQARLADAFDRFRHRSRSDLQAAIDATGEEWPGSLPTDDVDACLGMRRAFGVEWNNHQEARAWAYEILRGRPVIAVDGSQITPTKDFSVPVGAVQVGWFVNEHQPATPGAQNYVKDVQFEVLAPDELGDDEGNAEEDFPDWRVNQQRFVLECGKLCELMEEYSSRPEAERPLCFFDGSFVISFAGQLRENRARAYVEAVDRLLHCSRSTRTPLVGFVDSSFSRDVVTLLNILDHQARIVRSGDAHLFGRILSHWGDRSALFLCARRDSLNLEPSRSTKAPFYKEIAFTYLQLVSGRPPARLEMPRWILDTGRAEEIIDRVRAESVVGVGYPYAIESADALAVISQQDRERFYRILQEFLEESGMELSAARKMRSKRQRR
ncbi:MAG: DNA double-strand break repair nuclease NurA [Caldilineaceae bacterium]|nr:DNA double-strand break repair nuclease NurA [Caldilineaceae bacterium]HRJ40882.1 DNA double-strand break repair nuclease NurA [Caldilineaceae bacterium]